MNVPVQYVKRVSSTTFRPHIIHYPSLLWAAVLFARQVQSCLDYSRVHLWPLWSQVPSACQQLSSGSAIGQLTDSRTRFGKLSPVGGTRR